MSDPIKPDVLDTAENPLDCLDIWQNFSEETRRQVAAAPWKGTRSGVHHPGEQPPYPGDEASQSDRVEYFTNLAYWANMMAESARSERIHERRKRYTTEITMPPLWGEGEPITMQCEFCPLGLGLYLEGRSWGYGTTSLDTRSGVPGARQAASMILGLPSDYENAMGRLSAGTSGLVQIGDGSHRYEWKHKIPERMLPAEIPIAKVADVYDRAQRLTDQAGTFIDNWDEGHITNEQLSRTLCLHEPERWAAVTEATE